jgi:hypothetical protein
VEDRLRGRRDPLQRQDRAEPEPLQRRQLEPAGQLRKVLERVGAGVAVVGRVRERAGADRVEHDDDRATRVVLTGPRHFARER